ncbi:MAG: hypothetical protein JHC30_05880 [Caldisericum sp.]|nr:hypothetical protein [Caldisericum sp.]
MAFLQVANRAVSKLTTDISATDTSLTITTGDGDLFPAGNFVVTIDDERILVGSRSGDTFSSLARGYDGTTAASHTSGTRVELRIIARHIQELQNFCNTAGQPNGLATLDANGKVVQNPANATSNPTANAIVMSGSNGTIADGWISNSFEKVANKGVANGYASLDANGKVVQDPASLTNIVFCNHYSDPADAIADIGTNNATLIVSSPQTCNKNFTVPQNIKVKFERGGQWIINSGVTITFNGQIEAGAWQIFAGSGTITGFANVEEGYPEWWGAVGDDTHDDTIPIQQAIDSGLGKVVFTKSVYKTTNSINIGSPHGVCSLIGKPLQVKIHNTDNSKDIIAIGSSVMYITIENLVLYHDSVGTGNGISITGSNGNSFHNTFRHLYIQSCNNAFYSTNGFMNALENVQCNQSNVGFYIKGGTTWNLVDCYAANITSAGFNLQIGYSTLINCAVDNGNGANPYVFNTCQGISMVGCGAEQNTGIPGYTGLIDCNNSQVSIFGFVSYNNSGGSGSAVIKGINGSTIRISAFYELSCSTLNKYYIDSGASLIILDASFSNASGVEGSGKVIDMTTGNIILYGGATVYTPTSAPSSPSAGTVYYDSSAKKLKVYNGSSWEVISSS